LYWRYEQRIRTWEGLVDSVVGVSGAFYAVRRELASELPEGLILDDMYQPLCVARRGYRIVLDESARFWDSLPSKPQDEFRRKVRPLTGNFQLLQLAPWLLSSQNRLRVNLISHKLLRLLIPVLLLVLFLASYTLRQSLFYYGAFIAQVLFIVLEFLGTFDIPVIGRISRAASAFCWLNEAAVVALLRFLLHRRPLWKSWGGAAPSGSSENSAPVENEGLATSGASGSSAASVTKNSDGLIVSAGQR
jgi:cellulose synthase/poly-beta-1,6-N-acetylglucosamine synthase-like glycosyltransferase